jgi:hypothetical protein
MVCWVAVEVTNFVCSIEVSHRLVFLIALHREER